MKIEYWPTEKPRDYPKNARKWTAKAIEKVAMSLKEYSFRQPIVVDTEGVIVIGHLRRAAARHLGMAEVPVHVAEGLSPEKIRGLRLADNRTHEEADWDLELLAEEFGELRATGFELGNTGFEAVQFGDLSGVNFKEFNESCADNVKYSECPSCHHRWPA